MQLIQLRITLAQGRSGGTVTRVRPIRAPRPATVINIIRPGDPALSIPVAPRETASGHAGQASAGGASL